MRRSKTPRLKLRTPTSDGDGEGREKGEGIGERKNFFFFSTPLPFLRMPRRLRDSWGCFFLVIKTVGQLFFRFDPTHLYSDRGETT